MSTTIGSAVIEVGVDTKGVESGFAKIDGAVTKTGKTLESLGGKAGKGFDDIGAGGAQSAKKVEAATKNMIGAIQRTTASLEAGSKTGAKYYETLANQRGVNIEALRPYLAQLDAVKAKQEAAAKAADAASNSVSRFGAAAGKADGLVKNAGASALSLGKSLVLGAAVGLTFDTLKSKVFAVIGTMAELKTISEKTGSSVESLSKLGFAAKQSGSDINAVAGSLAKLSKGMAGANADSKGAGLALSFLGLSAKDAAGNLKDPADMFAEIAKKLILYKDGAGKVALAQALLGKSGADMLPTLKLIGEQGDIAVKVTDAQATAARQYERDLVKLSAQKGMLYKTIAVELLPTMSDFVNVMLEAGKKTNVTNGAVKGLADDHTISDWADAAGLGLARLLDLIVVVPKALSAATAGTKLSLASLKAVADIGGYGALRSLLGDKGAVEVIKKDFADVGAAASDFKQKTSDMWSYDGAATEKAMQAKIDARLKARAAGIKAATTPVTPLKDANFDTSNEDGKAEAKAAAASIRATEKAAAAALKASEAYSTFIAAIKTKTAESKLELATGKDATESQKLAIKFDKELAEGKFGLSAKQKAAAKAGAEAALEEFAADEALVRSKKSVAAATQVLADERSVSYAAAIGEAAANEELVRTFGLSKDQIEAQTLARMEGRLAQRASLELDDKEVANLERMIEAKKRNGAAVAQLGVLNAGTDVAKAKELLDVMTALDDATKSAASSMADSFGKVGSAIGSLTTALSGYERTQAAIAMQLASSTKDAGGDGAKIAKANAVAAQQSAQAQIRSYGDMAGAAKGFFKESATGYKVLQATEKTFRAVEMAMAIENTLRKSGLLTAFTSLFVTSKATETAVDTATTGTSVVNSGIRAAADGVAAFAKTLASLPFPFNVAAGAAVVALLAGAGVAIAGGGGGGGPSSKERQEAAGTGSVFGDSSAKSESLSRSIELAAANSSIELTHTAGMLASLKAIENSIGGLANLLVRSSGLTGDVAGDVKGSAQQTFDSVFGKGSLGEKLTGGLTGKIIGAIFGGKVTTIDTGLTANATSVASVAAGGLNAQQYTDIKKSGGLFSKDKYSSPKTDLGAEANDQFAKVILNISNSVKTAAGLLGVDGAAFTGKLNSFVVDIGRISLKGLSGTQIQEALETVFSKLGDDMAQFGVAGLTNFQKVGEGYFETLTRVATNYANLNSVMESIGTTFGAAGMSSIAARENLIALVGGIDELASKTSSFAENFLNQAERLAPVQKYVTDQLAAMGLQSLDTRDKFKDYTLGLANSGALLVSGDITTRSQEQYVALLALSEAFAKTHAATVDLTKSEQEIADERKDLQGKLDELTMTQAQLATKARAAIDGHNLALYDQVIAAGAAKDAVASASEAAEALLGKVDSTFATLQKVVEREKAANATAHTAEMKAIQTRIDASTASVTKLKSLSESLKSTIDVMNVAGTSDADARTVGQAQIQAALVIAKAGGPLPNADALKEALSSVTKDASDQFATYDDYLTDFYKTQNDIAALGEISDAALSVEQKTLDLLGAQKDASQAAYDAELARLNDLVETTRTQIDVLKGMDTSLLTINQSLQAVLGAIAQAQANPIASATGSITKSYQEGLGRNPDKAGFEFWQQQAANGGSLSNIDAAIKGSGEAKIQDLYKNLLGRTADAGGLDYWLKALNSGASLSNIEASIKANAEYKDAHKVPGFATGGDFAGGLRMVGENGPELEATGPARIFNASQTRSMLGGNNNAELIAELRAQRDEQRSENDKLREIVESHLYAIAKNTLNTAETLEAAAVGDVPLATKEIAV